MIREKNLTQLKKYDRVIFEEWGVGEFVADFIGYKHRKDGWTICFFAPQCDVGCYREDSVFSRMALTPPEEYVFDVLDDDDEYDFEGGYFLDDILYGAKVVLINEE